MNYFKVFLLLINLILTFTSINGLLKDYDDKINVDQRNEIINSNTTESNFGNLTFNFASKNGISSKESIFRTIRSSDINKASKTSSINKQNGKNSKNKTKKPQKFKNKNEIEKQEDNYENEKNNNDDSNENDQEKKDTRPNDNKKTNAQKKQKNTKKDRNDNSVADSGIESLDEDESNNVDNNDQKNNLKSSDKNGSNKQGTTGSKRKNPKKKKDIIPLKSYDGYQKLKRPQKGTYGTRKEEKERLLKKFNVEIKGDEFSSEHVFGNKVNLMGATVAHSREGKVGKAIESTGLAYYEQDTFHKLHVGSFSDKKVTTQKDKYAKSGMTPNEYRKFQQMAMRDERPGDAIQLNLIGYAVLPGFTSSGGTKVDNSQSSNSNEKNIKGTIANDSFFHMIKQNAHIFRLEGTKVVSQKLSRQEQVELIVARVIATDSARFTAKQGENPKEVWKAQVNAERVKARAFLDSK